MPEKTTSSPLWLAAGAATVGVLLGGAAVALGLPRTAPSSARAAAPAPIVLAPPAPVLEPVATPTLSDAVANTMGSVVNLESTQGLGAGVIVDPSGVVLTNYHVVAEALRPPPSLFGARLGPLPKLTARFANDLTVDASVLVADPEEDLAIVRLEAPDGVEVTYQAAAIGRSSALVVGQDVFAIGNPLGLRNTVSRGIVSAVDRTGILTNAQRALIQLDASINLGNSGGPLFNLDGELVGIVTARPEQAQGIAFALPMDHVRGFVEALENASTMRSGVIGITLSSAEPPEAVTKLGYRAGLVVARPRSGGPAAAAGMQDGDVVVALRGKRLDGLASTQPGALAEHLQKTVRGMFEGEILAVTVVRESSVVELDVEIAAATARDQVFIDAEELLGLGLDRSTDVPTVARVMPGSQRWEHPADLLGARIRTVTGTRVETMDDLAERLAELRRIAKARGSAPRVLLGFESKAGELGYALLDVR